MPILRKRFDLGRSPQVEVATEQTGRMGTIVSCRVRLRSEPETLDPATFPMLIETETIDLAQSPTWLEAEELRLRIATYVGGEASVVGPDEPDLAPVPCPSSSRSTSSALSPSRPLASRGRGTR